LHVEDAGNMPSMYRRKNALHVDLEKQVKSDNTTGLKTNKYILLDGSQAIKENIVFYCDLFFIT
jgi:hypothetical protein